MEKDIWKQFGQIWEPDSDIESRQKMNVSLSVSTCYQAKLLLSLELIIGPLPLIKYQLPEM